MQKGQNLTIEMQDVLNYILENELEDFAENPSSNHVYYSALVVYEGREYADEQLNEAIKELDE